MATNYMGRWDLVQMRCANFMMALTLLELGQDFGVDHLEGLRLTVSVHIKILLNWWEPRGLG
jgi:hypothetical protein